MLTRTVSALVTADWEKARTKYQSFTRFLFLLHEELMRGEKARNADADLAKYLNHAPLSQQQVYVASDSIMVVSKHLFRVLEFVQLVQSSALLAEGTLLRGCVAYGKHFHEVTPNQFGIVSEPVVLAVAGEKDALYPRVILHPTLAAREEALRLSRNDILLPCDDGLTMVQPFMLTDQYTLEHYRKKLEGLKQLPQNAKHPAKWAWMLSMVGHVQRHQEQLRRSLQPSKREDG